MRSVSKHRNVTEKYIGGECAAKRVLDQFHRSHFPHVHVSPFGVIPKSEPGKWRLILDLSSPEGGSINDGISKELRSLSYMSIDDVAARVVRLGRRPLMAKFDLKSVYWNIPVHPDDRWLLGMVWEDKLFVDTALPFGLCSAPIIFNAIAEALAHIMRKDGIKEVDHCFNDFSLVGPPESKACREDLDTTLETCNRLSFPVAEEKTDTDHTFRYQTGFRMSSVKAVMGKAANIKGVGSQVEAAESVLKKGITIAIRSLEPRM